jgi:hypothetical protein
LVFGSAGIAAIVASLISTLSNHFLKTRELKTRDLELALGLARLKNEQLFHVGAGERAAGRPYKMDFYDPMMSVIQYLDGLKEYRKTGTWAKAADSHK